MVTVVKKASYKLLVKLLLGLKPAHKRLHKQEGQAVARLVMKFGGTSVATIELMDRIAHRVAG